MLQRARLALGVFALSAAVAACGGEPPAKEMQDAQTAIDAAQAAGADVYAVAEFNAAQDALTRAREAVVQRDYRLALNNALDSRERAQNAASEAAVARAAARTSADQALRMARMAMVDTQKRLDALDTRANAKALTGPKEQLAIAQQHLQEASAAFAREDYVKTDAATRASMETVSTVNTAFDAMTEASTRRRR